MQVDNVIIRPGVRRKGSVLLTDDRLRLVFRATNGSEAEVQLSDVAAVFSPARCLHLLLSKEVDVWGGGKKKVRSVQFQESASSNKSVREETGCECGGAGSCEECKAAGMEMTPLEMLAQELSSNCLPSGATMEAEMVQFAAVGPKKSYCNYLCTDHYVIQVEDTPFSCIPLSDIDLVAYERLADHGNQTMEICIVQKDRETFTYLAMVHKEVTGALQAFFAARNVPAYSAPQPVKWKSLLKTVREDGEEFDKLGGWSQCLIPMSGTIVTGGVEGTNCAAEEEDEEDEEFDPASFEDEEEEEFSGSDSEGADQFDAEAELRALREEAAEAEASSAG